MTDIISTLDQWDKQIMLWLNHDGGAWADAFWFNYSSKLAWVACAVVLLYYLIRQRGGWREAVTVVLITVLAILLADQISSGIIKPLVERPRPSRSELADLLHTVNGYRGGRFGFVSSHAANSFAIALWASALFKGKGIRTLLFAWAIGNSYSRIYLGVHYLGDILGGTLVGLFSGWCCIRLYRYIHARLETKYHLLPTSEIYPAEPHYLSASLIATVMVLALLACF